MKQNKKEILNAIDQKISLFEKILSEATYRNRYNSEYDLAYYGSKNILAELYSEEEAEKFTDNTDVRISAYISEEFSLKEYKLHITKCISQLQTYRERIELFLIDDSETVINWPLLKCKLIFMESWVKESWKIIVFVLFLLGLVAGAINDWGIVSGFVNSTFK